MPKVRLPSLVININLFCSLYEKSVSLEYALAGNITFLSGIVDGNFVAIFFNLKSYGNANNLHLNCRFFSNNELLYSAILSFWKDKAGIHAIDGSSYNFEKLFVAEEITYDIADFIDHATLVMSLQA